MSLQTQQWQRKGSKFSHNYIRLAGAGLSLHITHDVPKPWSDFGPQTVNWYSVFRSWPCSPKSLRVWEHEQGRSHSPHEAGLRHVGDQKTSKGWWPATFSWGKSRHIYMYFAYSYIYMLSVYTVVFLSVFIKKRKATPQQNPSSRIHRPKFRPPRVETMSQWKGPTHQPVLHNPVTPILSDGNKGKPSVNFSLVIKSSPCATCCEKSPWWVFARSGFSPHWGRTEWLVSGDGYSLDSSISEFCRGDSPSLLRWKFPEI